MLSTASSGSQSETEEFIRVPDPDKIKKKGLLEDARMGAVLFAALLSALTAPVCSRFAGASQHCSCVNTAYQTQTPVQARVDQSVLSTLLHCRYR